jgi:hypothetical protein
MQIDTNLAKLSSTAYSVASSPTSQYLMSGFDKTVDFSNQQTGQFILHQNPQFQQYQPGLKSEKGSRLSNTSYYFLFVSIFLSGNMETVGTDPSSVTTNTSMTSSQNYSSSNQLFSTNNNQLPISSQSTRSQLVKAIESTKFLAECPSLLTFFLQVYPKTTQKYLPPLIQNIMLCLELANPNVYQLSTLSKDSFRDLITAQVIITLIFKLRNIYGFFSICL